MAKIFGTKNLMDKICLMHLQYIANGMNNTLEEIHRIREKYGLSQVALLKFWDLGIKQLPVMRMESIADMAQNKSY